MICLRMFLMYQEGKEEQEDCRQPDQFHEDDVDGPGRQQAEKTGRGRFGIQIQIVAAEAEIDQENDSHVNVGPDHHAGYRFPGRPEALHDRHVDRAGHQQAVGEKRLEETEMRKSIDTQVGCHQILHGTADSQKIGEFVNALVFEDQHEAGQPDQDAAQVQGQHILNRPLTSGNVPGMPGDFRRPDRDCQSPADIPVDALAGILRPNQQDVEQHQRGERGQMGWTE